MGTLSDKYLNKIIEKKLFDGPGDIPDTLEGLNANDYTAVVYNAVKEIIQGLRESGELKADQNLDAAGITAQILLENIGRYGQKPANQPMPGHRHTHTVDNL